jgi:hypothetical protein
MTLTRERVERLCGLLADATFWQLADEAGVAEALMRVVTTTCEGSPGATDHGLVADLDSLDEAMARAGFGMVTHPDRNFRRLPGSSGVYFWECPAPRPCSRVVTVPDINSAEPASCPITGHPLRRMRLQQ